MPRCVVVFHDDEVGDLVAHGLRDGGQVPLSEADHQLHDIDRGYSEQVGAGQAELVQPRQRYDPIFFFFFGIIASTSTGTSSSAGVGTCER